MKEEVFECGTCGWVIYGIEGTSEFLRWFIAGATGEIVQSADGKSDTVLVAKFDLNQIKVKRHSWGVFRDRRPELYKALLTLDGKTEMPAFSSTVR